MISVELNVTERNPTYELNLTDSNSSQDIGISERVPKYVGARAYCTPTDDGAIITLTDYEGTTQVEIKNGRSQLNDEDYKIIAKTVLDLINNELESDVFMQKEIYDSNKNGIVDNAELVNGYSVEKDVPENALFTDTQYESLTSTMIDSICEL